MKRKKQWGHQLTVGSGEMLINALFAQENINISFCKTTTTEGGTGQRPMGGQRSMHEDICKQHLCKLVLLGLVMKFVGGKLIGFYSNEAGTADDRRTVAAMLDSSVWQPCRYTEW